MVSFSGDTAAYFGPVFLVAVGLPFLYLYLRNEKNWWVIIPAGVMITLAVIAALNSFAFC